MDIMRPVSSINITSSDKAFICGERSFLYIVKSEGPRSDPQTPCFIIP